MAFQSNLNILLGVILTVVTLTASCANIGDATAMAENEYKPIRLTASAEDGRSIVSDNALPCTYTIFASAYFTSYTAPESNCDYFVAKPFIFCSGMWTAEPAVYWPVDGKLDILSIACEKDALDVRKSASWHEGNCSNGIEVNLEDGECLGSEILYAAAYDRTVGQGDVPMQFRHAQSWLQFVINTETEILRIDRVVIENVYIGGLFRISNNVYMDAEWSFRGHRKTDLIVPGTENLIPDVGTPSICNVLLPEQDACNIAIHYSTRNSTADDWSMSRSFVYRYKASANPWFYGEKNIFQIGFSFSEIKLEACAKEWEELEENINLQTESKIFINHEY